MGNPNEPMPHNDRITSFKIVLYDPNEEKDFAYSSARPIEGSLQVECKESVPAYGIEIALIQTDYSESYIPKIGGERRKSSFNYGNLNQTIVR